MTRTLPSRLRDLASDLRRRGRAADCLLILEALELLAEARAARDDRAMAGGRRDRGEGE